MPPRPPEPSRAGRRSAIPRTAAALLVACTALSAGAAEPAADDFRAPRLGVLLREGGAEPEGERPVGASGPARLVARWAEIEVEAGRYSWEPLARRVERLRAAGHTVALVLAGSHPHHVPGGGPPAPFTPGSVEAWLRFVRSAVAELGPALEVLEIGVDAGDDPDLYALLLKQSALAARAEARARSIELRIAPAAVDARSLDRQRRLWERDLAAYIDLLPVRLRPGDRIGEVLEAFRAESLLHPPASPLWAIVEGPGWSAVAAAVEALGAGAAVALFELDRDEGLAAEQRAWAAGLDRMLREGYSAAPRGALRLAYAPGPSPPAARVVARFFREEQFTTAVVFTAPASRGAAASLVLDVAQARNVRLLDPLTGQERRVGLGAPPDGGPGRALDLPAESRPGVALFDRPRAAAGVDLPDEALEVAATRSLTAEEIIARYQQVQQEQDDRIERWTARGRIDFHFRLAQGGSTVDVSIDSTYFWERGRALEWEQTAYYVNGNRVRWRRIPELPLIQPEKVITLPLDLTLDKTYVYRLDGEARVDGRPAWVLAFEPADPGGARSLYRGRVWIDRESFVRLRAAVVQDRLESPVLSNEEIDSYAEHAAAGGRSYWMLSKIDGQQVWNAAGRNLVVRREVRFSEFEFNPPAEQFAARREAAYASDHQMLRDTEHGFRYLERQDDGERTVKERVDPSTLFAAAGAFKDSSRSNVLPLAGVNYFNYDLFRRNLQLNVLFAGAFAFVTLSDPEVFGGKLDLTVDAALSAFKGEDRVYSGDDELLEQRIETRSQNVGLRAGVPLGKFFKLNLLGDLDLVQYFHNDDADERIGRLATTLFGAADGLRFVLPQDHLQLRGGLEAVFNRRGWELDGTASWAARSDWEPWGLQDAGGGFGRVAAGGFVVDGGEPLDRRYSRFRLRAAKEWFLPAFQKVRGSVNYLDGARLDRYSRYQFSFFGDDRLNGFSGSGVRFDDGLIGRAGYSFNLFEAIRFDAALERAWVARDDDPGGRQVFTGLGLSANLVGPWKTVINFNYGYALQSDIPDLEGGQEFLLLVFKLF